jgi:hypothetical protein
VFHAAKVRQVHGGNRRPEASLPAKEGTMRQVQIIPENGFRLYGAMVAKEVELAHKRKGTFRRSAPKEKDKAKWRHSSYSGWIRIARGMGEVVMIEVQSKKEGSEWQLLHAILGFIDRHFASSVRSIHIQYR